MDFEAGSVTNVARAIQLALAPVFLLTGIAGLLNVMTNRLARIIDRARMLGEHPEAVAPGQETVVERLQRLEQRRQCSSIAITACTIAALLLCMVIATLFFEALSDARLGWLVGVLFTGSTLSLVVGLAYFLREVHLAMRTRIELPRG